MKLNQINSLVQGKKSEITKEVTTLFHEVKKDSLFDGLVRVYQAKDEDGESLPREEKKPQLHHKSMMEVAKQKWSELWDLVATQDKGNQEAKADIAVNGTLILKDIPVTTLLFLEKQLNDLETFMTSMPTPDPGHDWIFDPNTDQLKSNTTETVRTKKVPRNHVKAPATDKHPAQVEVYMEDVPVGRWALTLFTGRLPAQAKAKTLSRIKALKDAVKLAREEANSIKVTPQKISDQIFSFILES